MRNAQSLRNRGRIRMLLEFEIENEAAFAVESTFSLVASKLAEKSSAAVRSVGDIANTEALTAALILGKNGSGKSTLISTLRFVSHFVNVSALDSRVDAKLPYSPNLLVEGYAQKPTRYRVLFSVQDTVYEFEFSYVRERIISERMEIADKSTRFRKLYTRDWDEISGIYKYTFGEAMSGSRQIWARNTRPNALYLSTASQLNAEVLLAPFQWLSSFIATASVNPTFGDDTTAKMCFEDDKFQSQVVRFLRSMDINVASFEIERENVDRSIFEKTFSKEFIENVLLSSDVVDSGFRMNVRFRKDTKSGQETALSINSESTGTQSLFMLAGPLFQALKTGQCLVIDEINTSLHPIVVQHLISLFSDPELNARRAQLIFTSHDVSVLRDDLLRRDQIWLIENDGYSAEIVALSDYSPRRGEALERGYLSGRYGGVPILSSDFLRGNDDTES